MPRKKSQTKPSRHILMVGTAPSCSKAPIHDPRLEVWAPNGSGFPPEVYARVDRWFQIHRIEGEPGYDYVPDTRSWLEITEDATRSRQERWKIAQDPKVHKEMPPWLVETRAHDAEVWLFYMEETVRNAKQYPADEIAAKYGTYFICSTFDWMMMQAIDEMRDTAADSDYSIEIAGIDMEFDTEYFEQRDSMHHWMDMADQLGIKVDMPVASGLALRPLPYPFSEDDPEKAKLVDQRNFYVKKKKEADDALHAALVGIANLNGQLIALEPYKIEGGAREQCRPLEEARGVAIAQAETMRIRSAEHAAIIKHIAWHLNYLTGCGGDPSTREDRSHAG
jgi:hypothetical protein